MAGYGAFNAGTVEYTVSADLSKFLNNTNGATDALDELEEQAKKTDKGLDGFKKKTDKVADAVKNVNNETKGANSALLKFGALLAAAIAANALRNAIDIADAYGQMASRIRNATSSTEEYEMVQQRLLATANGTYRSLSEAQEIYLGLESSLKDLGYTTNEVLDITDSFSYALVRDAARKDQAVTATDALSKALMKGKIDADGFASIMAATPSILEGFAKPTGKTTGEVRQLGATGKLSVEALNEGLLVSLERSKEMADNMKVSVGDAFTVLDNALYSFVGRMDESSGATDALSSSIVEMSKLLQDPATIEAAATLATAIVTSLKSVVEFSVQAVNGIKDLGRELARITGGPDLENLFDVSRSLDEARDKLATRQNDNSQTKQTKLWKDRTAWLEKEIKRLEAAEHRLLFPEQYANTAPRTSSPAAVAAPAAREPAKVVSAVTAETKKASKAKKELTEWEKEGLEIEKLVLDTLIEINKEEAERIRLAGERKTKAGEAFSGVLYDLSSTGNNELDRLKKEYEEKQAIIAEALAAEATSQAEHDATMIALANKYKEDRAKILADQASTERQQTLDTLANVIAITSTQMSQLNAAFEEGSGAAKAFFIFSQGLAAANAVISGLSAGMAIREAYAKLAGTTANPGMALAGEIHAKAAELSGFAAAGIITGQTIAGGRFYGGPVDAKSMYRVNEGGKPEIFNAANGAQYMIPNQRGEVVSNANAAGGVQLPPIINIIEDKSRAGQYSATNDDGQNIIDVFIADFAGGGRSRQVIKQGLGLRDVGY